MPSQVAVWMTAVLVMLVFSMSASIAAADDGKSPTTAPSPDPGLSPKAVVKIVVDALAKNDPNDSGIKTAFKFASPGNQQATGPIEHFIPMVKSPSYQPMLNSKSVEVRELAKEDNDADELAIITDSAGSKAYYIFHLSKQTDGDVKDCWMTDGVTRVEPKEDPAKPQEHPRTRLPDGQSPA